MVLSIFWGWIAIKSSTITFFVKFALFQLKQQWVRRNFKSLIWFLGVRLVLFSLLQLRMERYLQVKTAPLQVYFRSIRFRNMPAELAQLRGNLNMSMPGNRAGIWLDALDAVKYGLKVDPVHDQRYDDTLCTGCSVLCRSIWALRVGSGYCSYLHSPAVLNVVSNQEIRRCCYHDYLSDLSQMEKANLILLLKNFP